MRKSCAKPVDCLGTSCEYEHNLYPGPGVSATRSVPNPQTFPGFNHTITPSFSTAFFHQINLLHVRLSPLSTGLITNTTKYI